MARLLRTAAAVLALCWAAAAGGADGDAVKKAIDKGVAALKDMGLGDGRHQAVGVPALQGLTLLECGVMANDPAVQKRAAEVRQAGVELSQTYSLALAVMFLDRLGEPADVTLIQSMGVRLLAGQNNQGGWSYSCPRPPEDEIRRLTSWLGQRNEQAQLKSSSTAKEEKGPPPLPKEIQELMKKMGQQQAQGAELFGGMGDNSNTQFAVLGLWIARRHGVPAEKALQRTDARFRNSQNGDGGWGYIPMRQAGMTSSASMTAAGLLGVGAAIGSANEAVLRTDPRAAGAKLPRDPAKDPAVRAGLLALGTSVGQKPADNKQPGRGRFGHLSKGYYFLWSLERVAVAYGLNTIGNKDWYAWGCEILLPSQGANGTWQGEHGPEIDTCFALLFLRKANLAQDLTATLKGRVQDPGEVTLKAGGVGGEGLLAKGLSGLSFGSGEEAISELPEVAKLRGELVQAAPELQPKLIDKLKDTKGVENTLALASSIPHLAGPSKNRARDALAERLTRMTATTLRDKFQDEDVEVRRAAVLAAAMKDDKAHLPDLVGLLDDPDPLVVRAALAGLKSLAAQDLGADAPAEQRARTVAAWKAWWAKQKK